MNTKVEKACHVPVVDKRKPVCSHQMRAVIGTLFALSTERETGKRGGAMKHRTGKTAAGLEILWLLRQLGQELGASYRLMRRDLHVV